MCESSYLLTFVRVSAEEGGYPMCSGPVVEKLESVCRIAVFERLRARG